MAKTYTPIATQTLTSSAASVTFSSIPSTYTDLVIVLNGTSSSAQSYKMQFNGDTASNYSSTYLLGTGSTATSSYASNATALTASGRTDSSGGMGTINIMNYANTTTYKTALGRGSAAGNLVITNVGLWRSTAAINSIVIIGESGNVNTGSTFTLYGILKA